MQSAIGVFVLLVSIDTSFIQTENFRQFCRSGLSGELGFVSLPAWDKHSCLDPTFPSLPFPWGLFLFALPKPTVWG